MTSAALGLVALAGASAADAQVARGREIARAVCSACHDVGADQMFPPALNQRLPSFREIANRPGVTRQSLRRFIGHTHWDEHAIPMSMPDTMLTDDQRDAVASYILSLRQAHIGPA